MNKELESKLKAKLEEERKSITAELETFAVKDKDHQDNWDVKTEKNEDADLEEQADELQEKDNLLSVEHSLELKLKDVNVALEKIGKGEYGKCEKCGKDIEPERLEAMPAARLCMSCNK